MDGRGPCVPHAHPKGPGAGSPPPTTGGPSGLLRRPTAAGRWRLRSRARPADGRWLWPACPGSALWWLPNAAGPPAMGPRSSSCLAFGPVTEQLRWWRRLVHGLWRHRPYDISSRTPVHGWFLTDVIVPTSSTRYTPPLPPPPLQLPSPAVSTYGMLAWDIHWYSEVLYTRFLTPFRDGILEPSPSECGR